MAVSNVSICNIALTYLSTSRIESLTEDSESARKCNAIYEDERDSLLYEHNWNFARAEAQLATIDDDPVLSDKWTKIHQLPVDCLRVIRQQDDYDFMVYEDKFYSNVTIPKIEYIKKVTDPTLFSQGFTKALAARLAAILAYGITQNATLSQAAEARAENIVNRAKQDDAQEGVGIYVQGGHLLDSR